MAKYSKPIAEEILTTELCEYGCGQVAVYKFKSGKLCCSKHFNSCPAKRKTFSETQNHAENARKSLETRERLGITKTSQIKAAKTRRDNGHYKRLAKKMRQHWAEHPWSNNLQCPILPYKNTSIVYQGTYELEFLEELELKHGIDWLITHVRRGPCIHYIDENSNKRLYLSDFLIDNVIYEIKSNWTWNKKDQDPDLEQRNKAKLNACIEQGYTVILVLNGDQIKWA